MKKILLFFYILMLQSVNAQVSVFDCYVNNSTPTQTELNQVPDYYLNCIELSDNVQYEFNNNDNNKITAQNFIHIEDGFHAGPYSTNGKMHLRIGQKSSFDVVATNYTNLDWVGRYEKLELAIELPIDINMKVQNFLNKIPNTEQLNPFLDWEMRVYGEFYNHSVSPDPIIIDGFYTQNYTPWMMNMNDISDVTGQQSCEEEDFESYGGYTKDITSHPFMVRFAPPHVGHYLAKIYIEIGGAVAEISNLFSFTVIEVGNQGYVSIGDNKRFLKKGQETFYPVGINMPWPETHEILDPVFTSKIKMWNSTEQTSGIVNSGYRESFELPRAYDNYKQQINHYGSNGVNLIRTIMNPNSSEIEWEELGNYYNRLHMAQELDEILELCESKDMYILWNFQIHMSVQKQIDAFDRAWTWDWTHDGTEYCYKTLVKQNTPFQQNENEPIRFFTDEEAKKYYKQRLRYILARWGYSTNIGMMELFSEINNSGFNESTIPLFYEQGGSNNNWIVMRDWQLEMAAYIKSFHNGKVHLLTASYAGHKSSQDDTFLSENIDLMSTNDYDFNEPNFNSHLIQKVSKEKLNGTQGEIGSYTLFYQNANQSIYNVKPLIFSEMGTVIVDQECRSYPNNSEIEMNRSQWQGLFSGIAGGFGWESWYHPNNVAIYGQVNQFISGHDFDGGNWHPGASKLIDGSPKNWVYKDNWTKNMIGKNKRADLMYLRSGDGNYAIGVITNTTYNVYSVASCFDNLWEERSNDSVPIEKRWKKPVLGGFINVNCNTGIGGEKLKLRGMNAGKYYINFFYPTNLSIPFRSTEDWGPEVEMDLTVNGSESNYIVLFMARKKNHDWMPTAPSQNEFEEILSNKELWINSTLETAPLSHDKQINSELNFIQEETSVRLHPNPGVNELIIEFNDDYPNAKVYFESINGAGIGKFECNAKSTIINLSSLHSGTYIVKIIDDSGILLITKYIKL